MERFAYGDFVQHLNGSRGLVCLDRDGTLYLDLGHGKRATDIRGWFVVEATRPGFTQIPRPFADTSLTYRDRHRHLWRIGEKSKAYRVGDGREMAFDDLESLCGPLQVIEEVSSIPAQAMHRQDDIERRHIESMDDMTRRLWPEG